MMFEKSKIYIDPGLEHGPGGPGTCSENMASLGPQHPYKNLNLACELATPGLDDGHGSFLQSSLASQLC